MIGAVWWAEVRKLVSRPIGRLGLVLLVLIGAAGPLLLEIVGGAGISMNGADLGESMDLSATNAVRWSLYMRKFFVVHVLLTVLASLSYAGELQSHTLREDLVRPVPRWLVLLAKWAALGTWAGVGLALQLGVATALGLLLHEPTGDTPWNRLLLGYGAAWITELGFAAFALAASVVVRSVAGSLLTVFLFLVFEQAASWFLALASQLVSAVDPEVPLGPLRWMVELGPFLPSSAWAAWSMLLEGADPVWQPWAALAAYTAVAVILAERVFDRTDVP